MAAEVTKSKDNLPANNPDGSQVSFWNRKYRVDEIKGNAEEWIETEQI